MNFYLIPVLLPCISSLTVGLLGSKFGKIGTYIISIVNLLISTLFSIKLLYDIIVYENTVIINIGNWINLEVFKLDWVFIFDPLSIVLCTVVLVVSFWVHVFSINYMGEDPHVPRFFSYLTLFTFFMLLLVVSENFVLFYFGWEGIGLTSFLLINFWTTRVAANKAALKAIIVNRFGDLGLLMGFSFMLLGI